MVCLVVSRCLGQSNHHGDNHYELVVQGHQKYCFEQDYQDGQHYVTKVSASTLQTELTVRDRK